MTITSLLIGNVSLVYILCLHIILICLILFIVYLLYSRKQTKKSTENILIDYHFFYEILDNLPFPIFIKDINDDYKFIYWNKTTEQITGINREQILGKTDFELYPDDYQRAKNYREVDEKVVREEKIYEAEEDYITRNGEVYSSIMIKCVIGQKNKNRWLFSARWDITEIKRNEKELSIVKEEIERIATKQELALRSIDFGLIYIDTNYVTQWESASNVSELKIEEKYIPGKKCYETAYNRDEPCENCPFAFAIKEKRSNKIVTRWNDLDAEVTATPTYDEDGEKIIGGLLRVEDITEKLQLNKALQEAKEKAEESNRLKSAFLANMSHEIRTPLNAIIGFSEIISVTDDANERTEYMKIISANNDLLLQLINDILDLSKIEAGTLDFYFTDIDLNDMLEGTYQQTLFKNSSQDVKIVFEEKTPGLVIFSDKSRLSQVIHNFLSNAMKFTQQGNITFGYRVLKDSDEIYFYVKDTGIGIPEDKVDSVFDRFVKLNSNINGTGLGLSISRIIIENLGGTIGVNSTESEGSEFWFIIPIRQTRESSAEPLLIS